jgi:hypothetical protein
VNFIIVVHMFQMYQLFKTKFKYTCTRILIIPVIHYTDIKSFKIRVHGIRINVLVNNRSKSLAKQSAAK